LEKPDTDAIRAARVEGWRDGIEAAAKVILECGEDSALSIIAAIVLELPTEPPMKDGYGQPS